jgi:hypothetical protein
MRFSSAGTLELFSIFSFVQDFVFVFADELASGWFHSSNGTRECLPIDLNKTYMILVIIFANSQK